MKILYGIFLTWCVLAGVGVFYDGYQFAECIKRGYPTHSSLVGIDTWDTYCSKFENGSTVQVKLRDIR